MNLILRAGGAFAGIAVLGFAGWAYRSTDTHEIGTPGLAMQITDGEDALAEKAVDNTVPEAMPKADPSGELAVNAYKNVQVLGHLSSGEFTRLMVGITEWVAPDAGCGYCHAPKKNADGTIVRNEDGYPEADLDRMWSDDLYSKVVSRRMIQMTQYINEQWPQHVGKTGVTCWTCHRGNNVPKNIWFNQTPRHRGGYQNGPTQAAVLTSLPSNAFETFLVGGDDNDIRVQTMQPLPGDNRSSIKQAEWTYGLMMHMSSALGVNCTFCHNSRAFGDWEQSPPQRATAWHGIRMARDLNNNFLIPLGDTYPTYRLGPHGDAPKANCATCHNGAYKPMLGQSMLGDWPSLAKAVEQPERTVKEEEEPEEEDEGTGGAGGQGGAGGEGGAGGDSGDGDSGDGDSGDGGADAGDDTPAPAPADAPATPTPAPAAPPAPAPPAPAPAPPAGSGG